MSEKIPGTNLEANPENLLNTAKEWAGSIMEEISQGGRGNSIAQNAIRLYSDHIVEDLREAAKMLETQGVEVEKIQEIRVLADEVENSLATILAEQRKREGVRVADEFEKLAKRVQELSLQF